MASSAFMPTVEEITENERAWVGFLRLLSKGGDPTPTLSGVQALRLAFGARGGAVDPP